jgi:hypothetical protein
MGPDGVPVRLQPRLRDRARPRAGGENDVLGGVSGVLAVLLALHDHLGRGLALLQTGLALDHGDLVLLHKVADARGQPPGHAARALDDLLDVEADIVRLQAELVRALEQVVDV